MIRLLLPILFLAAIQAEDAPKPLDPTKPSDAIQIVAQIAAQVPLRLAESQALLTALQTLDKAVKTLPVQPAQISPQPLEKKD